MADDQIDIAGAAAGDDIILPFQLESSALRGRGVRLGAALDEILSAHDYPRPVSHLVAEAVTLTLLLSSMLKYDGIFTLQIKGDGPISMLVADVTSAGVVRGCASFDAERLEASRKNLEALKASENSQNHLAQYLGQGYLAFTVDQGDKEERYQGIVELKGASLVDCAQHYFVQSEQIKTGIKMAIGQRGGAWRAGGIMLQYLPEDEQGPRGNLEEDDWRRAMVLLDSCTEDEFLDDGLGEDDLLIRLFHEEGVRAFDPHRVSKGCRCAPDKVSFMISTMSEDDLDYMTKDGRIEVTCEFCSREFILDRAGNPLSS